MSEKWERFIDGIKWERIPYPKVYFFKQMHRCEIRHSPRIVQDESGRIFWACQCPRLASSWIKAIKKNGEIACPVCQFAITWLNIGGKSNGKE